MRHRFIRSIAVCAGVALAAAAGAGRARAQAAPGAAKPKPAAAAGTAKPAKAGKAKKVDPRVNAAIESAKQMMAADNRESVEAGIQSLGLLGTAEAVEPLTARIRQGLPPELLETAIVTLMALGQPNAGPVLYELTAHRRPEVRLRAVEAIAATKPPGGERGLLSALSDADARVRSAAAVGLGDIGASSAAIEKLFLALDRGNMEASGAIGKIVAPNDTQRLTGYLGKVPLRNLGPALAQVLQRKDVPESAKLEVIVRLEETGTPEVRDYLGDLIAGGGETYPPNVSRALLRAMQEIAE
jgi:HEAT repeats